MRQLIFVLASFAILVVMAPETNACTCAGTGSPCESYGSAAAVFVGTPIGFQDNKRPTQEETEFDWSPRTFKFAVEQSYLGVDGTEIEISTGMGGGDCGYTFQIGQRYLVYAYRHKGKLTTNICTRTKPFASATEDLAFLGNLSSAPTGATIYGQVVHGFSPKDKKPLEADVFVVIQGDSVRREVLPDAQGRFRVSGLPPGKFKVSLQFPETLTAYNPEREVTVADRGCGAVLYNLTDNGKVSGRVLDPEGRPVARMVITLVNPETDPAAEYVKLEVTDNEGRYNFSAVPAGRYVIALNFNHYPQPEDPTTAYPQAFYPGVLDQPGAEVITLGLGQNLTDINIRMPPRRTASILSGIVVRPDGSPVPFAPLGVMSIILGKPKMHGGVQVDAQGRFTIHSYVGQRFILEARPNGTPPMESSGQVPITLERPAETIKLVVTKRQ